MSVVSVKVPKEIKEKMERTKDSVDWPEEIRRAIIRKLEEIERKQAIEKVEKMLAELPVQPKGTISSLIREDRDAH